MSSCMRMIDGLRLCVGDRYSPLTYEMQLPWLANDGLLKVAQPPFMHCALVVGEAGLTRMSMPPRANPPTTASVTVFEAVSITYTGLSKSATYADAPSGVMAT